MAKYDYSDGTHEWEEQRPIADRTKPARCPQCDAAGVFVFHPSKDLMVPRAFMTRFSDIAPLDRDGHAMSFTETVKSGRFDRYRREDREEAESRAAAEDARMEPIRQKRARNAAWKKLKAAERRGLKVYTDEQRMAGMALAEEARSA